MKRLPRLTHRRPGASSRAMFCLCRRHLLAVLTVLAVLCGFAHQVHERFEIHHHCVETDACCDHRDDSHSPDHQGQPCDHALCSHSIVALLDSPAPVLIRTWVAGSAMPDLCLRPPGVEPADIEHPPQLG